MRHLVVVLVALSTACNGGKEEESSFDPSSIPSGPLEGTIGGEPWSFGSGYTDDFLSDEEDFFTYFEAEEGLTCGGGGGGNGLIGSVPTAAGTYEFGASQNVTFFIEETFENLVATKGGMVVDSVAGGVAKGSMIAEFDADNQVGGSFEVTICEDPTTY